MPIGQRCVISPQLASTCEMYNCKADSSIDDVIQSLQDRKAYFRRLKDDGFRLLAPVNDHMAELEPPDSEDSYWVECRSSECYGDSIKVKFPPGRVQIVGRMCTSLRSRRKVEEGLKTLPFRK